MVSGVSGEGTGSALDTRNAGNYAYLVHTVTANSATIQIATAMISFFIGTPVMLRREHDITWWKVEAIVGDVKEKKRKALEPQIHADGHGLEFLQPTNRGGLSRENISPSPPIGGLFVLQTSPMNVASLPFSLTRCLLLSVSESFPAPTNQTGSTWASPFRGPPPSCTGQNRRRKNIGTVPASLTRIRGGAIASQLLLRSRSGQ